jgi:hypothetical protein
VAKGKHIVGKGGGTPKGTPKKSSSGSPAAFKRSK